MAKKKMMTALSVIVLAGSIFSTAAFAKEDNGKGSLVSLGDSITFGYNLGVNNNQPSKFAFPYIIGEEADLRVRDLGVPGWTTTQLLSALQTDEQFQEAVKHAKAVTLDIGSNDLLQALKNGEVTPEQLQPVLTNLLVNLKTSILKIRSMTDAPIAVYNIYNPFQVTDTLNHGMGDTLLQTIVNPQIQALVASLHDKKVIVADAYDAFGQNQANYVRQNDVHPTILGQKMLAEVGLEALSLDEREGKHHSIHNH